ncbi:MAG TPA: hypothetical protein VNX01_13320 [Bacteroidia bacterium]|jgi:hypothetical protein|nr:hypothetical protein [Bacteroidia bacterium]
MKKPIYVLITSLILGSCASLTKTQISAVNEFAQTSKKISVYPSKIIAVLNEIHIKNGIITASTYTDNIVREKAILNVVQFKVKNDIVTTKLNLSFQIIDKYAQSLLLISSDKHTKDIDSLASNFGAGIDSLISIYKSIDKETKIPDGFGAAIGKLISLSGKQYIKIKQANEIKKLIPQADVLLVSMTNNIDNYLSETATSLLTSYGDEAKTNYEELLKQNKASIENDKDYFQLLTNIHYVEELRKEIITTIKDIQIAHDKLCEIIGKRTCLKKPVHEIQVFKEDVKKMKSTITKLTF